MSFFEHKAVFFDVGGTLLTVHPSVGDVYAHHARDYGFKGTADELNSTFKQAWLDLGGMESLGRKQGAQVERAFWREIVFKSFQAVGGLDRFDDYFDHIYDVFRGGDSWRVFEDVKDSRILDRLKDKGIKIGVISNWDSRLPEILGNMKLAEYFDFILASTVVGSAKPDIKIFQEALKLSGVDPNEACHIGDEFETDIKGANNAGLASILIDRKGRFENVKAHRIKSFHELV